MKAKLENLSRSLRKKRHSLLQSYDAEDLHQTRVGLRRMRSHLKSRSGGKARSLRHELGKLADATNPARDWDTLVEKTHAHLDQPTLQLLGEDLRRYQASSHLPALAMLQSDDWSHVLEQWDAYLRRHPPGRVKAGSDEKTLKKIRERVDHAWLRASHNGAPRNWHKLRIALKDLRYRLEADAGTTGDREASKLLKHCKRLQTLLGDWHDTVIHLQLVREIAGDYDPETDIDKLKAVRDWCRAIEAEGRQCLDATKTSFQSAELARLLGRAEGNG